MNEPTDKQTTLRYRWLEHPSMEPRPREYFIGYWTTMPRPSSRRDAEQSFTRLVRLGQLVPDREGT